MKIVEVRKGLLVREDGMVKNINPNASGNTKKGSKPIITNKQRTPDGD